MNNINLSETIAKKLYKISKKDLIAYLSIAFFSFLSFGQFAVSIAYNNDGIGRYFRKGTSAIFDSGPYINGVTKGRWAYPFFANLYNGIISLPFFVTVISIILFVLISIVIWKLFKIESLLQRVLVGAIICSSPIFVHYFFYTGDGEVYATGMLLISIGVYLFTLQKKSKNGIGILCCVIGLACYPALFGYCTALVCLYLIHSFYKKETLKLFLSSALKLFFLSFSSLIIYFVITKVAASLLDVKMTAYKNADSISPIELIKNLPDKFILTYSLFANFWRNANHIVKAYVVIMPITLIYMAFRKNKKEAPLLLLTLVISIPMVFVMYLITYEGQPYPGFQFGLIPLVALLHIPLISIKNTWIKNAIFILPLLIIFNNVKSTNQIILKYRLNCESSRTLTFNIVNEIQKQPSFDSTKKIALIGNIRENNNFNFSGYIPDTKGLNSMHYPAAFSGSNTASKIKNQFKLQGFDFEVIERDEVKTIDTFFKNKGVPEFPKEGSVFEYNDLIVVNLGNEKQSNE